MYCNLEYKYFLFVSLWLYLHHWLQCSFIAKSNHCCKATHSKLSLVLFWNTHTHTHTHKLRSWEVFRIFSFCVPITLWLGSMRNLVFYVNNSNINFYRCVTAVLITGLSLWVIHSQASHKSNPSSVSQGVVDSYSTLGHVEGGNSCGGHTLMRVATTHAD
jgi:hypothetical protein